LFCDDIRVVDKEERDENKVEVISGYVKSGVRLA